jgi:hypothetical protein
LGLRGEPFVFDQTKHGGSYESLIEIKWREQVDQTTQPNFATARQNGIAKNGNDQRASFDSISFAKFVQKILDRFDGTVTHCN